MLSILERNYVSIVIEIVSHSFALFLEFISTSFLLSFLLSNKTGSIVDLEWVASSQRKRSSLTSGTLLPSIGTGGTRGSY